MFKSFVGIAALALALGSVGCQSTGKAEAPHPVAEKAMVATGATGSVVYLPSHGSVQILSTSGMTSCDVCKSDAALYFSTGKMSPKCTVCGATHHGVVR
jgi:hypothetical protein